MHFHSNFWTFKVLCLQTILTLSQFVSAQYSWASSIDRTGWTATADSYQEGYEPAKVLDGDPQTIWHTPWNPTNKSLPHWIQIDMKKAYVVNGFRYKPRFDHGSNGNIGQHTITLSNDESTWSNPIQFGTYLNDNTTKTTFFSSTTARYIRLTALTEAQGQNNPWSSVAEIEVYSPDASMDPSEFAPPPTSQGRWDVTVSMPIVPVAGALTETGDIVFWSAYLPDEFGGGTGSTQTSVWNPESQIVTPRTISNTQHDMFCPGISLDANGRITVMGGNDNKRTSIYSPDSSGWIAAAPLNVGRGYQSSATVADGRIFTIGGSWSGGHGGKNGEIYDPGSNTWTLLSGCDVEPMLTNDAGGVYRADNHAWLFAYKSSSVFQAGPSRKMNWYNVSGDTGSWKAAGTRASDPDSMCGNAVMFDAVNGLILTAGGSPNYSDSDATANTHLIELGAVGDAPAVTQLPSMSHARAFANGVALPDGTVLIVGGQSHAEPFTDTTPVFATELFNPSTREWTTLANIAVPRTYHSIALLLPDATVLSGGGGLNGHDRPENHFDLQVFSPPYLFKDDGTRAVRPVVVLVSQTEMTPGQAFTVTTDGVIATFSLVRYGSATHTVNTDQRRVPLEVSGRLGTVHSLTLPEDPGVLIPGYWMLFAINEAGVPSVATKIKVLPP
ncbi:galactose Oxidase, W290h mutant [Camillea tinctor]|nr:galactose Oxidase, W290h mutant [Camillea tinctor]